MSRFEPIQAGTLESFVIAYNLRYARGYHLVDFTFHQVTGGGYAGMLELYDYEIPVPVSTTASDTIYGNIVEQPADNSRVILSDAAVVEPRTPIVDAQGRVLASVP